MISFHLKNTSQLRRSITIFAIVAALLTQQGIAAAATPPARRGATPAPTQAPNAGQALEIGPPVYNISANPGQTFKTQISVRDVSPTKLLVRAQVNDFVAAGEDGSPKVLLDEKEAEDNPYSLRKWIAPLPSLTLEPKQLRQLPVTINVPANAAPGGYYGVIRFTATPPDLEGTGVALSASLGSLLLVRVNGPVKQSMEITEFSMNKDGKEGALFQSAPFTFVQRLRNTGNIHEQPTGHVTVKDMFGKVVGATNVNLAGRNVLPGSIRKFDQTFDKSVIGDKRMFGKYTATLDVKYAKDQTISDEISFWIIPYSLIGIVIIILIALFFIFRFGLKAYTRRVLTSAQRGRRR